MKTKNKQDFDAVKYMRQQRQKLSNKLSKMTPKEIVEYFRRKRFVEGIKPSA